MSWVAAETLAEGPTPEARIGHTATYDPDSRRIFVFGGSKNRKWFNDVHILDTQSWRWSTVEVHTHYTHTHRTHTHTHITYTHSKHTHGTHPLSPPPLLRPRVRFPP